MNLIFDFVMFVKKFDYSYWNYVSFTDLFTFSKIVPGQKFEIITVGDQKSCFLDHVMISLKIESIIEVHDHISRKKSLDFFPELTLTHFPKSDYWNFDWIFFQE